MYKTIPFTRLIWLFISILAPLVVLVSATTVFAGGWIPEGTEVAFMANWSGTWDIYVLDIDRRLTRQLTNDEHDNRYPSWSPDGSQIIYHSGQFFEYTNYDLYIMDADGDNARIFPLSEVQRWSHEAMGAFSPDGAWIAYHSNIRGDWDIYLTDITGEDERLLIDFPGDSARLVWSPNGTQVAFASGPSDYFLEIYVMDVADFLGEERQAWDMSAVKQLTYTEGGSNFTHSWSPDGTQIIFVSDRDGNQEIYVMSAAGANQHNLTNNINASDAFPTWLPDGRIVFASTRGNIDTYDLYIMDADGTNVQRLTHGLIGHAQAPVARPQ